MEEWKEGKKEERTTEGRKKQGKVKGIIATDRIKLGVLLICGDDESSANQSPEYFS